jgi:flagellar assembly factor FliW
MHATEKANDVVEVSHPSGTVSVPSDALMHFTTPMWGFEQADAFALLPTDRQGLWWFISTNDAPATFVLADPFVASADYEIDLNDAERDELGLRDETDALALVMLVMPSAPGQTVTANFRAPLIFNLRENKVKQVVNRDDRHQLAQPVSLSLYVPHNPESENNTATE